jgi:outer membrane receptor protein involved in Fe transport
MRTRLLASSMISGAAIAAVSVSGAQAQQVEQSAPAASTSVQELVVTGSRIPQKNLTSVSPVTTVNNQTVKLQGTTNVEDLINNLPQAFADFGQFESNGASGTATIDLRGLGNTRTLVLVDGKRLQPGDPLVPVADINMIPPALIDRVEVLTGGASAVYGSDAVAGVVNFIMKHNYEGLQVDVEESIGEHENNDQQVRAANTLGNATFGFPLFALPTGVAWAGQRTTVTITGGANTPDGKGNVEFYLGYTDIAPVLEGKYDWSTCGLATNTSNYHQQYCGGSSTSATGRLNLLAGDANFNPTGNNAYGLLGAPGATALAPYSSNLDYNFSPLNYIQRPDIRYQAGEFSHYEVAPWLDLYSSFMFMDDNSSAQVAGSGAFQDAIMTIPCNDPLLSAAQANTLCGANAGVAGDTATATIGRRNVEGDGRISDLTHEDYRIVFGAKGDLGSGWTYDISGQYGKSMLTDIEEGYFLNSHEQAALDVIPGPNGTAVCASGSPCVPWNIWSPGGVTQAAENYLSGTAINSGYTTEQVVTGNVSGDLGQYGVKLPWASDGVGISLGAEYRREFLQFTPDVASSSGDLAGFGGAVGFTQGSQSDKDVFGEIRIPLIQNMPFFKDLTFEGGARYSDYTSGGGNWTYKAGLDWQIVPDLRLRGSYERAVRAPNVDELFAPQEPGLIGGTDPCAGPAPSASAAACYNTFTHTNPGISEATFASTIYGSIPQCVAGQCAVFTGGNPDLTPETAKTYSFGFVFTPTFFHGFSFSADYFNIKVANAIDTLPFSLIVNGCAQQDIAALCSLINRSADASYGIGTGNLGGYVQTTEVNIAQFATSGVDINADYRVSLNDIHLGDHGSLDFNLQGTWLNHLETSIPGQNTYDCAGLYGPTCGTPAPKWRHQFRVTWTTPWNLTLSANWRFLSSTSVDFNTDQLPLQQHPGANGIGIKDLFPTDAHIPDFSYFDLSFQYKFRNRYTFRGGINNIFDRTPPLLDSLSYPIAGPAFGNGNTYPQVFDPLGRVMFIGLTADF